MNKFLNMTEYVPALVHVCEASGEKSKKRGAPEDEEEF